MRSASARVALVGATLLLASPCAGLVVSAASSRAPRTRLRCFMAELPVSEGSSLAELRAFVKAEGLDVKTSGAGRNKAAIYEDVVRLWSSKAEADVEGAAAAAATAAVEAPIPVAVATEEPGAAAAIDAEAEPAAEPVAVEPAAEEAHAAAPAAEPTPAAEAAEAEASLPPTGFEWGGTF